MAALLAVVAFLGTWQLYTIVSDLDAFVLPPPSAVAASLVEDCGLLAENFAVTATEILLGLLCALVLGIALTALLHLSGRARRGLYPLLVGTQVIPIVLIAPLLAAWFGFGVRPKHFIVALVCFFPIVVPTLDALRRIDPDRLKLLRTLGASRWQTLRFAEAPRAARALHGHAPCSRCALTAYTAARRTTTDDCPGCGAPLAGARRSPSSDGGASAGAAGGTTTPSVGTTTSAASASSAPRAGG
jgi:ABC-type nitrate/sulfonate/bicarbonate transport system permease component